MLLECDWVPDAALDPDAAPAVDGLRKFLARYSEHGRKPLWQKSAESFTGFLHRSPVNCWAGTGTGG
jgi:hypothetical protein